MQTGENITIVPADIHTVAGMSDGGFGMAPLISGVAFLKTGYNTSTQVIVWQQNSKEEIVAYKDSIFDGSKFIRPKPITFQSLDDEFTIHGQLFIPPQLQNSNAAIIFTHGGKFYTIFLKRNNNKFLGPPRQMYSAFHYCIDYAQLYALNQYFATNGFIVLSINYRMGVGMQPSQILL